MDVFEWCICLIVSHTSPSWAWCVSTQLRLYCLIQKMKLLSCNKRQTWCIALYTLTFFLILAMDFYRATIMWLTLKEGDISSPPWICIWHNETKYDATMHLQGPSIGWNKILCHVICHFTMCSSQVHVDWTIYDNWMIIFHRIKWGCFTHLQLRLKEQRISNFMEERQSLYLTHAM